MSLVGDQTKQRQPKQLSLSRITNKATRDRLEELGMEIKVVVNQGYSYPSKNWTSLEVDLGGNRLQTEEISLPEMREILLKAYISTFGRYDDRLMADDIVSNVGKSESASLLSDLKSALEE